MVRFVVSLASRLVRVLCMRVVDVLVIWLGQVLGRAFLVRGTAADCHSWHANCVDLHRVADGPMG